MNRQEAICQNTKPEIVAVGGGASGLTISGGPALVKPSEEDPRGWSGLHREVDVLLLEDIGVC